MWCTRKKEVPDEDAELRALAKAYSEMHDRNKPTSIPDSKPSQHLPAIIPQPSTPTQIDTIPELPMDDIIQGSSLSYTRAESKLYANEEPCDTWRHIDVPPQTLTNAGTHPSYDASTYRF
jgi:hypothetical protein